MTRSKTSPATTGGVAAKQQSNRTPSSTSLKAAKPTESNFANNNVVAETPAKGSGADRVESTNAGKVKVTSTAADQSGNVTSSTLSSSLKSDASQSSSIENPTQEKRENKGSVGFEHQQKTISFFDPPVRSSSSTSIKITTGSTSGISKPKSAEPATNQQAQKQVKMNVTTTVSSNNNNPPASANKTQENKPTTGGSTSPAANSTSNAQQPKPAAKTFPAPVTTQSRYSSNVSRSMVSLERSRNFRAFIEKAMNDHKIFACCGVYPAIRNALKKRGWVEKPGPLAYSRSANTTVAPATKAEDESDVAWMTRMLKDYPADFIWVIRRDNIDWKNMTKEQLINRFPKAWFTTKVGIAACLQHMHWFSEAGVSDTFFPRCYRLCLEEERLAFQDDYRLTACMSYLRYFVDTFEAKGHSSLADVHSKITPLSVDFAARQLGNYIRMRRHEDIDWLLPPNFMTQHWDAFIHQYYAVVHEKKRLRFDTPEAVHVKYETAKKMLHKVAQYWPQIQLDGVYNMWICKPGARSRGKGIVIMNNLEKILDLLTQSNFRECNWVVQKYIERPMLIYKTKFDIRQWFLITDWTPLTIWFYKESYVRFCTKPFDLEDFHESIHLCNNAIQCRYQNSDQRDSNLPDENMWSSDTFQAYLKTIGRLDAWPLVYSGMKQAIVGVLLASQETIETRKGCYELYGADFMLTEDFRPWLIEINSCPCMAASTSVTARMCAQCLEDTIKVVVDRRHNKNADTGMFEMIYRQNTGSVLVQQFSGHDLTIVGKKLSRDIEWPMAMSKSVTNTMKSKSGSQANLSKSRSENNKQTLSELLQKLRVRNQEMFQGTLASQQSQIDSIFDASSRVIAGGKTDTTALIEKMRALKSTVSHDKEASSAKRIYPSPDPTKLGDDLESFELNNNGRSSPGMDKEFNPVGKGEDPFMPIPKYTDMNSIAYLMKNSSNTSGVIGDLMRASKETAQELIVRTRKIEAAKQKTAAVEEPVAKTLAEVKAMVDSGNIGKSGKEREKQGESDKNGKSPRPTPPFTYLSNILMRNDSDCNNDVEISTSSTTHEMESSTNFHNRKQKIATHVADKSGNKYCSADIPGKSESKVAVELTNPGESYSTVDTISVAKRTFMENSLDHSISPRPRETKSLLSAEEVMPDVEREPNMGDSCRGISRSFTKFINDNKCKNECDDDKSDINYRYSENNSHDHDKTRCEDFQIEERRDKQLKSLQVVNEIYNGKICPQPSSSVSGEEFSRTAEWGVMRNNHHSFKGRMYSPLLLNSTTSQSSSSDSDSDFNNKDVPQLTQNFIPVDSEHISLEPDGAIGDILGKEQRASPSSSSNTTTKLKPIRHQRRASSTGSKRCCSKRYPCYRVILEPQNYQQQRYVLNNKRKSGPTLPMKTVNLLLPSNYTFY